MNLKHHVEKICKFRIIKFKEYKYLGEMNYNLREGYGVEFYYNGDEFNGKFKNGIKEGYRKYY